MLGGVTARLDFFATLFPFTISYTSEESCSLKQNMTSLRFSCCYTITFAIIIIISLLNYLNQFPFPHSAILHFPFLHLRSRTIRIFPVSCFRFSHFQRPRQWQKQCVKTQKWHLATAVFHKKCVKTINKLTNPTTECYGSTRINAVSLTIYEGCRITNCGRRVLCICEQSKR